MFDEQQIAGPAGVPCLALEVELAGRVLRVLESCHSVWMFDVERRRFCRVPRGARLARGVFERAWHPYYHLDVDLRTGGFAVALNESRTHLLRSWVHGDNCSHCSTDQQTGELVLDAGEVDMGPRMPGRPVPAPRPGRRTHGGV